MRTSALLALFLFAGSTPQPTKVRPREVVTDGDRGNTYHSLERMASHVKTRFHDGTTITSDRTVDGQLSAHVHDAAGNEVAKLKVVPVDAANDNLDFTPNDGPPIHTPRRANLRPTLDWSNAQAYSLWQDRKKLQANSQLEWQDTLVRPRGSARRDVKNDADSIESTYQNGLVAVAARRTATHQSYLTGKSVTGPVLVTNFTQDGNHIGQTQWWPDEQTLAWSFPGLTKDEFISASHLKALYGGWTFTPDLAWMNVQALAFHEFGALVQQHKSANAERNNRWYNRAWQWVAPTAQADEPGCDYLHYLDGTIYRFCCDNHDQCYQSSACTSSSWWVWNWGISWQCDFCNFGAVLCFGSGAAYPGHVFWPYPPGDF